MEEIDFDKFLRANAPQPDPFQQAAEAERAAVVAYLERHASGELSNNEHTMRVARAFAKDFAARAHLKEPGE